MAEQEEYVSILVPKRHLTRIYAFVGSLEVPAGSNGLKEKVAENNGSTPEWTRDLIERQYRESPAFMKRFQTYLAEHAGERFSTTEIADALEAKYGWNTVAGALGAYGRRVKNRYKQSTFPFESAWNYEKGQAYHSMTEEVASIIREL